MSHNDNYQLTTMDLSKTHIGNSWGSIGGSRGGARDTRPPPLGKNVKWVELPSGCVVPGSWSGPLALKAKLICGGLLG